MNDAVVNNVTLEEIFEKEWEGTVLYRILLTKFWRWIMQL